MSRLNYHLKQKVNKKGVQLICVDMKNRHLIELSNFNYNF